MPVLTVPDRFRAAAATRPDRAAVVGEGGAATSYEELDRWSNRVANALAADVVQCPVLVVAGVQTEALVGMLGVQKAGRLYGALDPKSPPDRIASSAALLGASVLVADPTIAAAIQAAGPALSVRLIDFADSSDRDPGIVLDPEVPAIAVFTSGSTGEPKAVLWKPSVALLAADAARPNPDDHCAAIISPAFAAAPIVYVASLVAGASIYLYDPSARPVRSLGSWMNREGIAFILAAPSVFRPACAALEERGETVPTLTRLVIGGEAVTVEDLRMARRVFPNALIENRYGSAEAGAISSYLLPPDEAVPDSMPGGRPFDWHRVRIVDDRGREVPTGRAGRVELTGHHVACGAWGDPALSAKQFVPGKDGSFTVATGDLGSLDDGGALVILGRADSSVKIRGQLVDPIKVENVLLTLQPVLSAAVTPVDGPAGTRLIAHVVLRAGEARDPREILRLLSATLPAAWVPAVRFLEALPTTSNGKTDRRLLVEQALTRTYVAPATATEARVAAAVARVLSLDKVGVEDGFSDLGGDSLSAVELMDELEDEFGGPIDPTALFGASTVRDMARLLAAPDQSRTRDKVMLPSLAPEGPEILIIPGGGGNIFQLEGLAQLLPASVAVPVPAGFDRGRPDRSVEAAAGRFAPLLQAQPAPRVIVGYSYGASVALELATAVGGVEVLVLIDPPALNQRRWAYLDLRSDEKVEHRTRRAERPTPRERTRLGRVAGEGVLEAKIAWRYVHALRRSFAATTSPGAYEPKDSPLWHASRLATPHYHPRPFVGRTLIVHRRGWPRSIWSAPVLGGDIVEVEVAVDEHLDLMRQPGVAAVAQAISAELGTLVRFDTAPQPGRV